MILKLSAHLIWSQHIALNWQFSFMARPQKTAKIT